MTPRTAARCLLGICILLLALMLTGCAGFRVSLPITGPGPLTNLGCAGLSAYECDRPRTNAAAHVGWALAIPGLGHAVGGRRGMRWAGAAWIGATLLQETFAHEPATGGGPEYPSEVRTDLLTRIVPTLILLGADWLLE